MKRKLIIGAAAVFGIVFLFRAFTPVDEQTKQELGEVGDLDSAIARSLQNANPTEAELQREVQLLREAAQRAGEVDPQESTKSPDVAALIARPPEALADPGYDLAALETDLIKTLQLTDDDARRTRLREVASFLAAKDTDTAARFMKAILGTRDHFTDGDALAFATVFIDSLSREQPAAAAAWTEILPERLKYPTHQLLARNWAENDPMAADAWVQTLTDAGLRANAIRMISHSLAISDPQGLAPSWVQALAQRPEDGPRLSEVVVKHLGKTDFEAAYAWANGLKNSDDREQGLVALTKTRAEQDASAAANWASSALEGDVRARAIQASLVQWLAKDPAAAATWVDKLGEPAISDASFDMIAMAWLKKDQAKAASWVAAAPVASHRKEYVQTASRQ